MDSDHTVTVVHHKVEKVNRNLVVEECNENCLLVKV